MGPETPASAEGDLGRTPLAHLLVYALDRRLTGALFLTDGAGTRHVVRFVRGSPVKIRPSDDFARLGEILLESGEIAEGLIESTLASEGWLGEALVLAGLLSVEALDRALDHQFIRRAKRLFQLPPDTVYAYYDDDPALDDWGAECSFDALEVLWMGVKEQPHDSATVEEALSRLGDTILRIDHRAVLQRFRFTDDDLTAMLIVHANPLPMSELLSYEAIPEETLRRLVYALLITRQLDLGVGSVPAGAEDLPGAVGVGRVRLRPTPHRSGAAAPDPPGPGERVPAIVPRPRRSRGASSVEADAQREDSVESDDVGTLTPAEALLSPLFGK